MGLRAWGKMVWKHGPITWETLLDPSEGMIAKYKAKYVSLDGKNRVKNSNSYGL